MKIQPKIDMPDGFIERLYKAKGIDSVVLESLLKTVGEDPETVFHAVLEEGLVPKTALCEMWASSLGFAYVNPIYTVLQCDRNDVFPEEIARKARAICLYKINGVYTVAMADPANTKLVKSLERTLDGPISLLYSLPEEIEGAIKLYYQAAVGYENSLEEALADTWQDREAQSDVDRLSSSASIIKLLDSLLMASIHSGASDIHLECSEPCAAIRFRVDGKLRLINKIPHRLHKTLCARLKVLCSLDISESRQPQDGRLAVVVGPVNQQFRASFLPGLYGEKVVLRSLGTNSAKSVIPLADMMMSKNTLDSVKRVITSPNGIFIVTGPTGSGKTTTLYSAIDFINKPDLNISTIEDPVEYQLEGINHFQVNHKIGFSFAKIMRSMLRQDPDVILVGEIRDTETAKIATEAALTGHMVLTTLHTNNSLQAVIRLVEMGVETYLVAPSIMGVMAQRLLRRICPLCKEPYAPSDDLLRKYFNDESLPSVTFYQGKGCSICKKTGYHGRIGVFEMIEITESIRSLIAEGTSYHGILKAASVAGFQGMRFDALQKVLLGLTTLEEVERGTVPEYDTE
ncbi:MAG: GspE/PulE family protein [Opitutales bacterium]